MHKPPESKVRILLEQSSGFPFRSPRRHRVDSHFSDLEPTSKAVQWISPNRAPDSPARIVPWQRTGFWCVRVTYKTQYKQKEKLLRIFSQIFRLVSTIANTSAESKQNMHLKVFDICGKLIMSKDVIGENQLVISKDDVRYTGIYIFKIDNGNTYTGKIVFY